MQRNVLIGNGINIQFGGADYLNSSIIARLEKNIDTSGRFTEVFAGTIDDDEMRGVISLLYDWSVNHVFKGIHSLKLVVTEDELRNVLRMSKEHSEQTDPSVLSVGMEDYLLLLKLFDAQWPEEKRVYSTAEQAMIWLLLDALYNEGKIQEIYQSMAGVETILSQYDNIFTVNYDTNIEKLTSKKVYHLHGSFDTLHHEYDQDTLKGWALKQVKGSLLPYINGKEYFYCNAILGFSGDDKLRKINLYNEIYKKEECAVLRNQHPELKMEPYPIDEFSTISGELDIIGLNPNNDSHIFKMIEKNQNLSKVIYYYHNERQIENVRKVLSNVETKDVDELWNSI